MPLDLKAVWDSIDHNILLFHLPLLFLSALCVSAFKVSYFYCHVCNWSVYFCKTVDVFLLCALEDFTDILLIRLPESANPQILHLAGF